MSESLGFKFKDRAEWRRWLADNHSDKNMVWVIIYKKGSKKKGLRYEEAVEEALCYGWIDSKMQSIDNERFRQRFSPRRKNSPWSKNNKDRAERMIKAGVMTEAGFKVIEEAKLNGWWDKAYTSKERLDIPEDLLKALKQNSEAWSNFKVFSNSAKLRYVYWIENAKQEETRRRRIAEVIKKAAQNIKPA